MSHAIDFVPVRSNGRTAPFTFSSLMRPEPAGNFPGFGYPILAPVAGEVVAAHDSDFDHDAFRGFPSISYSLTQRKRAAAGWRALAGNHIMIATATGPVVALCHLQQGSIQIRLGQHVASGDAVARCGNSGNSTEPHLHLQAISSQDVENSHAVALTFNGYLPRNKEIVNI